MFRLMESDQFWSDRDWCSWLDFVFASFIEELPTGFPVALSDIFGFVGLVW